MTNKERLEIIKQRINTIKLNTKIGSRRIADEENAVLLDNIEYNLNLILNNQEQSTILFNYIAEVYEELDSLMARLQDDYNNGIEFEQKEEDRLIIGNILDIFTNLEDALSLKKAMETF